ncbi:hypothetical protein D3C81_2006290 [compost metagenome]
MLGHLLELQRDALAGEVFHRAADLGHQGLAILEHRDVDHTLLLAANQLGALGDVRCQEGGVEGVVVHRYVAEFFLAFALDRVGGHGRDAQAGGEQKQR